MQSPAAIAQAKRSARTDLDHPLAQRGKIATERIDIEKSHAAAIDAQVMQAVRRDQNAARLAKGGRASPGIVGDADRPSSDTASTPVALRCGVSPKAGPT